MTGKELSIDEKRIIISLRTEQKKSYSEIGRIVSRSRFTVRNIIKRFEKENRIENKARSGRPEKLTDQEKRGIKYMISKEPFISARKISDNIAKYKNKAVHPETIRRCIVKHGFKSCTPRRKPVVSLVNRRKRIEFAKKYINKPPEFWNSVIFSDESKYNIFGSDGRLRVWRTKGTALNPKHTIKTVKHGGGGVMVWGCMSAAGVGNLEFIEGTMDQFMYIDILKKNLKDSALKLGLSESFYFQQDNDPKHTAMNVRMWLLYNTPNKLSTPPQSPDLNPIEHLWDALEQKIRKHEIRSKSQLKEKLLEEWCTIAPEYTKKLVSSMQNRLKAVIKMKGYPTKY